MKIASSTISGLLLGALLGILIGMSVSEVVGIVIGALASLLIAFFGLKEGDGSSEFSRRMIATFSLACIVFVFLGIYVRTRNLLAPSVNYYKAELSQLNLDSNTVKKIILLKKYGISLEDSNLRNIGYVAEAAENSSLYSASDSEGELSGIVGYYQAKPYDSVARYVKGNGERFEQFVNSINVDIPDTTVRKNMLLQLIAITYKN